MLQRNISTMVESTKKHQKVMVYFEHDDGKRTPLKYIRIGSTTYKFYYEPTGVILKREWQDLEHRNN